MLGDEALENVLANGALKPGADERGWSFTGTETRKPDFLLQHRDHPLSFLSHLFHRDGNLHGVLGTFNQSQRMTSRRKRSDYVPSDQLARYCSCSGVSLSMATPIDSSFMRATFLSRSSGTGYTRG